MECEDHRSGLRACIIYEEDPWDQHELFCCRKRADERGWRITAEIGFTYRKGPAAAVSSMLKLARDGEFDILIISGLERLGTLSDMRRELCAAPVLGYADSTCARPKAANPKRSPHPEGSPIWGCPQGFCLFRRSGLSVSRYAVYKTKGPQKSAGHYFGGDGGIRRWARKHAKIAFLRTFKTVFTRFSRIFTLKNHKKRILVPKLYLTIFQ